MTPLAPLVSAFFEQRLCVQLAASEHTRDSYAYALKLLFDYAGKRLRCQPCELQLEQLDSRLILDFLAHLENERGNSASTRNIRLAAIKSFMRFVQYQVPSALEQVWQILAIPCKKTERPVVCYLSPEETQALLDAPEPTTTDGVRDRAMLHLTVTLGLRVSELVNLRLDSVSLGPTPSLVVHGKGRRQRALPLSPQSAKALRAWLAVRPQTPVPELFLNARGINMTRSGFEYILRKHVRAAGRQCPGILQKRVSPHVLRHTCAMNTLQATRDIRKVSLWLGHASTRTTDIYLHTDPAGKLETINAITPVALRRGRFRPPDRLLTLLREASLCGVQSRQKVKNTCWVGHDSA
jgi:site-specific recombinase XerD